MGKSSKHIGETHNRAFSTKLAICPKGMHKADLRNISEYPTANHCKQAYLVGVSHQRVIPYLVIPERVGHDTSGGAPIQ